MNAYIMEYGNLDKASQYYCRQRDIDEATAFICTVEQHLTIHLINYKQ